jgi:DNA-binding NtrC family response regulator
MQQVYDLIDTVTRQEPMVLIQGESGTGKELVARIIHNQSKHSDKPFVPVNCGSISESVPEKEVVGHVTGLMAEVAGGILYFDEIAELAPSLRMTILKALKDAQQKSKHGVRVIAATTKELSDIIDSGVLQQGLFDMLNAVVIKMPPLRERREDISLLIHHFIFQICTQQKKRIISIHPDALDILMHYHWPGNLIQLQNVIERALALGVDELIQPEDLPAEIETFSRISKMT